MAGIVVEVCATRVQRDAFFKQVLMNINDSAAGENALELIPLQLVIARTATDHHGLDIQVIERVRDTMEQNTVVGDDFLGFIELSATALGVAATQIPWWQNRLNPRMPKHGLCRQTHLAEQPLRATAREVEHRL